jgi:hypothetical protein
VIQEYTTYSAYQALIDRVNHPILNVICQRIMKQELRHYAFYREHAKRRLQTPAAQKLTTYALKLGWTPVGDGMSKKEDVCHAVQFLFDGRHGTAIDRIEQKVRELPGLEWFDLFTRFAEQYDIPAAPTAWYQREKRGEQQAEATA